MAKLLRRTFVGLAVAAVSVPLGASPARADHHGIPHRVCVTLTLYPLDPPPILEACVPLPPVP